MPFPCDENQLGKTTSKGISILKVPARILLFAAFDHPTHPLRLEKKYKTSVHYFLLQIQSYRLFSLFQVFLRRILLLLEFLRAPLLLTLTAGANFWTRIGVKIARACRASKPRRSRAWYLFKRPQRVLRNRRHHVYLPISLASTVNRMGLGTPSALFPMRRAKSTMPRRRILRYQKQNRVFNSLYRMTQTLSSTAAQKMEPDNILERKTTSL